MQIKNYFISFVVFGLKLTYFSHAIFHILQPGVNLLLLRKKRFGFGFFVVVAGFLGLLGFFKWNLYTDRIKEETADQKNFQCCSLMCVM